MNLCGLCNDDTSESLLLTTQEHEFKDIASLYELVQDKTKQVYDIQQLSCPRVTFDGKDGLVGNKMLCIYTDGSGQRARHSILAYAGWGVSFCALSSLFNMSGP